MKRRQFIFYSEHVIKKVKNCCDLIDFIFIKFMNYAQEHTLLGSRG